MDELLQQRTRYILRARVRQAQTCPMEIFESACNQLFAWLDGHPVLGAVLGALDALAPAAKAHLTHIVDEARAGRESDRKAVYEAKTVLEHAAICLHAARAVASLHDARGEVQSYALQAIAHFLRPGSYITKTDEAMETLRDVALDGLFEYVDEQLDGRNAVLGLLLKYKQRCEWFRRHRLRDAAGSGLEGKTGERALAIDLYEYVLDQGVDFVIESSTASGEPDLVLRLPTGRHVVLDAKYISSSAAPAEIKRKLSDGFHQVVKYCGDYSEPDGFLVVFIQKALRLSIELRQSDVFQFLPLAGKSVYFIPVDICDDPSASKLGKATELTITAADLVQDAAQTGE